MAEEKKDPISLDLDLMFAPDWARQSPAETRQHFSHVSYQDHDDEPGGRRRDGKWNERGSRSGNRDREHPRREERRNMRRDERRNNFDRPDKRSAAGYPQEPSPRQPIDRPPQSERPPRDSYDRSSRPPRGPQQPPEPLPFEIRLLPEQKALGSIIRRVQTTHRAYPLRDIARLFLDNPAACLMRIELNKDQPQESRVYQCKVCGIPGLSQEEIAAHIATTHLDHFFDVADVEGEAPTGNFPCVARCGFSGELLGPPNHHSYAIKVQEMLRTRYPHKLPEEYQDRIEMVRDPEVIEQWREQAKTRSLYRLKTAEPEPTAKPSAKTTVESPAADATASADDTTDTTAPADVNAEATTPEEELPTSPPMERDAAERLLMREIIPTQISATRSLVATVEVAKRSPNRQIVRALNEILQRENRFPALLFFALRGAFRHRKLNLFKANDPRGLDFVMLTKPTALDTSYATEELRTMCGHVNNTPGITRQELLTTIAGADNDTLLKATTALNWLVERGHIIEYYNGVLCAPMDHPKFRYLPGERGAKSQHHRASDSTTKTPVELTPEVEDPDQTVASQETPATAEAEPADTAKPETPTGAATAVEKPTDTEKSETSAHQAGETTAEASSDEPTANAEPAEVAEQVEEPQ